MAGAQINEITDITDADVCCIILLRQTNGFTDIWADLWLRRKIR